MFVIPRTLLTLHNAFRKNQFSHLPILIGSFLLFAFGPLVRAWQASQNPGRIQGDRTVNRLGPALVTDRILGCSERDI